MFTGAEVIAIFTAFLTPIGAGFGALWWAFNRAQTRLQERSDAELARVVKDKDAQIATLRADLAEAYKQLFRSVGISARSAQTTATAVEVTRQVVQPLLTPIAEEQPTQGG